ncbi:hypothetical protein N3356_002760 [Micrococcus luteus]|nr:hypothetical protein [Micrococcus luteus]
MALMPGVLTLARAVRIRRGVRGHRPVVMLAVGGCIGFVTVMLL